MLIRRNQPDMKQVELIAAASAVAGFALVLFAFAGCSSQFERLVPQRSSGLPAECSQPDAFKPGSACAVALAATAEGYKAPRDNQETRLFLDTACADDAAWQSGSTCHVLSEVLKRAAAFRAEAAAQASPTR